MSKINVYLADDHTLFRQSFARVIRESKRIGQIREAQNGKELLALMHVEIPDLVIVDIEMPVMGGIQACRKIAESYPEVKIIVLSMHEEKMTIGEALKLGAHAFLSKVAPIEEFEAALEAVIANKPYSNVLMEEALQYDHLLGRSKDSIIQTKAEFSEREKVIIELICRQLTNRQISRELFLSEHTVRNHKVRIMKKARVKNVQGLVKFAVENGLCHMV